ncbi:MAG: hypothetical protein M0P77_09060 [Firmicutes bacterium]|nr:hypothetical protein [Bacillota bacterium]
MITTYLPIVYYRLPAYIGSHHLWVIVWAISLLLFNPKILFGKLMLLIYFYALFLWIMLTTAWAQMNEWNITSLWNEIYVIAVGASIITYINRTKDYMGFAKIIRFVLIFILITSVLTIITTIINPMYIRLNFVESFDADMARQIMYSYGAANIFMTVVFTALVPILIYYYKNNHLINYKKWIILILISLCIIVVVRMQVFANILFVLLFTVMAFISAKNRKRTIIILIALSLIVVSIPNNVYVKTLNNLSKNTSNLEEVSFKMTELAVYIEKGGQVNHSDNAVAGRAERFPMLLKVFKNSPFLGCFFQNDITNNGYNPLGGHLYWMNKLAVTGIIGFIFFLSIIIVFLKNELNYMQGNYRYYFILAMLSILSYGIFKNLGSREVWYAYFIIIPGIYYLPLLNKKKEDIIDNNENNK